MVKYSCEDALNSAIYGEIIKNQIFQDVSYQNEFNSLLLNEHNPKHSLTALLILDGYSELDKHKFSTNNVETLTKNVDPMVFYERTCQSPHFRASLIKIYDNYQVCAYFLRNDFLTAVVRQALNYCDDESASLLIKIYKKVHTVSFQGEKELILLLNKEVVQFFYDLSDPLYKSDFFIAYSTSSHDVNTTSVQKDANIPSVDEEKNRILFSLIQPLIIPVFEYQFTDPLDDLKQKYSFTENTYNNCATLFTEIFKVSDKQDIILRSIYQFMTSSNSKEKYLGITLFSHVEHLLMSDDPTDVANSSTELVQSFVDALIGCLSDSEIYVQSQALYTLQFIDSSFLTEQLVNLFNYVLNSLNNNSNNTSNLAIRTNACLCLPLFIGNSHTNSHTNSLIQSNLSIIIKNLIHNPLHLEALSDTLELVIENYDISEHALVICTNMIESVDLENIETATYLRIISSLIITLDETTSGSHNVSNGNRNKSAILSIYEMCTPLIYDILNTSNYEFFVEVIDLLSNVLYIFKQGDVHMVKMCMILLQSDPKEIINYSEEMAYLLDNFISYCSFDTTPSTTVSSGSGSDDTPLHRIIQFVKLLSYQEEDYLFYDDFICACKVIESLLLNGKLKSDYNNLSTILKIVTDCYHKLDGNSLLHGLEVVMNAFNVDYLTGNTIVYECIKNDMNRYMADCNSIKKRFKRVHDKKVGLLFCSNLMQTDAVNNNNLLDVNVLVSFFMFLITTYDQAELSRRNLKDNNQIEDDDSEVFDSSSEEYPEEDVFFCTPLDEMDIKMVLQTTFSTLKPNMVGTRVLQALSADEKQKVHMIIEERK